MSPSNNQSIAVPGGEKANTRNEEIEVERDRARNNKYTINIIIVPIHVN